MRLDVYYLFLCKFVGFSVRRATVYIILKYDLCIVVPSMYCGSHSKKYRFLCPKLRIFASFLWRMWEWTQKTYTVSVRPTGSRTWELLQMYCTLQEDKKIPHFSDTESDPVTYCQNNWKNCWKWAMNLCTCIDQRLLFEVLS